MREPHVVLTGCPKILPPFFFPMCFPSTARPRPPFQSNEDVSVELNTTSSPFVGTAVNGGGGGLFWEFASPTDSSSGGTGKFSRIGGTTGTGRLLVNGDADNRTWWSAFEGSVATYGNEVSTVPTAVRVACSSSYGPRCDESAFSLEAFQDHQQAYVELIDALGQSMIGYDNGECKVNTTSGVQGATASMLGTVLAFPVFGFTGANHLANYSLSLSCVFNGYGSSSYQLAPLRGEPQGWLVTAPACGANEQPDPNDPSDCENCREHFISDGVKCVCEDRFFLDPGSGRYACVHACVNMCVNRGCQPHVWVGGGGEWGGAICCAFVVLTSGACIAPLGYPTRLGPL